MKSYVAGKAVSFLAYEGVVARVGGTVGTFTVFFYLDIVSVMRMHRLCTKNAW